MSAAAVAKLLDHVEHELGMHDARVICIRVPWHWDLDEAANREVIKRAIREKLGRDRIKGDQVILVESLAGFSSAKHSERRAYRARANARVSPQGSIANGTSTGEESDGLS